MKLGVVGLVSFLAMGLFFFIGILVDSSVHADKRLLAATVLGGFWLLPAVLSAYVIVACRRESWSVNRLLVSHVGLFRAREIVFAHVNELRWICGNSGTVSLKTSRDSLRIPLDNLAPEQRLWLIRLLREVIPISRQMNWEQFCGGIAVQMNRPLENPNRRLERDEARFTRGRCDLYFGFLFVATLGIVFSLDSDAVRLPQKIAAPLAAILMWLFMRFQIPRGGLISKQLQSGPKISRWVWGTLAWATVPLIWCINAGEHGDKPLEYSWQTIPRGICYLTALVWMTCKADREMRTYHLERARLAAQEWRESETSR